MPAIELEPLAFSLPDLVMYEWLVFTSANGVDRFFVDGLWVAGLDARALAGVRVAAIGTETARVLLAYGIHVDLTPERNVAEALLDVFPAPASPDTIAAR